MSIPLRLPTPFDTYKDFILELVRRTADHRIRFNGPSVFFITDATKVRDDDNKDETNTMEEPTHEEKIRAFVEAFKTKHMLLKGSTPVY